MNPRKGNMQEQLTDIKTISGICVYTTLYALFLYHGPLFLIRYLPGLMDALYDFVSSDFHENKSMLFLLRCSTLAVHGCIISSFFIMAYKGFLVFLKKIHRDIPSES